MKYLFLITLLACLGCSVTQQNNNVFDIEGRWLFESHEFIGTAEDFSFSEDGQGSLYVFFGGELLSNCIGKDIQFLDEGKLITNLANQETLYAMNFGYNVQLEDSSIIFSVTNPNDSSINAMPVKFSSEGDRMIWKIDKLLEIVLTRND